MLLAKKNAKGSNKISFLKPNPNYRWYLCKLDLHIVENDSLQNLTLEQKLNYVEMMDKVTLSDSEYVHRRSFPLSIEHGYVYHIFGLCDVEGSYYVCLEASGELIIQYFDRGAW